MTADVPRLLGRDSAVFRFGAFAPIDPTAMGLFATGTAPAADEGEETTQRRRAARPPADSVDYVTAADLQALLEPSAPADRVAVAAAAANQLIGQWVQPDPAAEPATEPTAAQAQAGLELGHTLYRRHAAVGGVFGSDDLVARLPADLVKSIRDLLDADAHLWGNA